MRAKSASLSGAINSYLLAKVNLAPKTKAGYLTSLRCLERWLAADLVHDVAIGDLTADNVNAYLNHLLRPTEQKPKGKARMAHNTALDVKAFANWMVGRGMITEDDFDFGNVTIPKVSKDGRPTIVDADLDITLAVAEKDGPRSYAIWTTMLGHGHRLNEMRLAELEDIDFRAGVITIRGETSKSGMDHQIPLDPMAAGALDTYINDWRPPSKSKVIFLTEAGYPFTYAGWSSMMQRLTSKMADAGVKDVVAHRARGTWATNANRQGHSLADIKSQGGWRTDTMPLRYIKNRPMVELKRLPSPLASVVQAYRESDHAATQRRRAIRRSCQAPGPGVT